jgi:hypothetical protein
MRSVISLTLDQAVSRERFNRKNRLIRRPALFS